MSAINWNNGQVIVLNPGDTATCTGGLNPGQIYALFLYNSAGNDADATINVVWSNSQPPVSVTVPGTTSNEGLAALCFVSGDDTNTVAVSMGQQAAGTQVQAYIGSVKLPMDYTYGMTNPELPADGQNHPFEKFTRYHAVPESHWYSCQLQSNINQFISVQFKENFANVYIVNQLVDPANVIKYVNGCDKFVKVEGVTKQTISWSLQGNGRQIVWLNADSTQNAQTASISLQSLAGVYQTLT